MAHRTEVNRLALDIALLIVRIIVAAIFIAAGAQKLFGAFGGFGLAATVKAMGPVLGYLVCIAEFFGGIGLLVGLLSRFSAFWLIVDMIGAIVLVTGKNGFFIWPKPGYEFNLALIGLLVPVLLLGPGRLSVARWLPLSGRVLYE